MAAYEKRCLIQKSLREQAGCGCGTQNATVLQVKHQNTAVLFAEMTEKEG